MFRMAFHGGFGGNVWNALMTIPEARQVKRCMAKQDDCLAFEAIRKEAGGEAAVAGDKPRIIVNPDFVENKVLCCFYRTGRHDCPFNCSRA